MMAKVGYGIGPYTATEETHVGLISNFFSNSDLPQHDEHHSM